AGSTACHRSGAAGAQDAAPAALPVQRAEFHLDSDASGRTGRERDARARGGDARARPAAGADAGGHSRGGGENRRAVPADRTGSLSGSPIGRLERGFGCRRGTGAAHAPAADHRQLVTARYSGEIWTWPDRNLGTTPRGSAEPSSKGRRPRLIRIR